MIVAAGLTPAWQQTMSFDRVRLGEVNRAQSVHWCGSGKVLNVGVALTHLGAESLTVALVGGPAREMIEQEFTDLGVSYRWAVSQRSTRVCTTLLDADSGTTTELVENAAPATPEELAEFRRVYIAAAAGAKMAVLTGSLPIGTPASFYRELLEAAPCPAVLDVRGPELAEALRCRPLLVKPNREELAATAGGSLATDDELLNAMRELNERGAQWVAVTQGKDAVWVSSREACFRLTPPSVSVVNPIGAGDCLAAGAAWKLHEGLAVPEAVRWGVAAAAYNVTQLLPARLDRRAVASWAEKIVLERIA